MLNYYYRFEKLLTVGIVDVWRMEREDRRFLSHPDSTSSALNLLQERCASFRISKASLVRRIRGTKVRKISTDLILYTKGR